ncbi:MAG TPA: diacylglycerol kinase family protein, partial [Candidatus Nanoarchaeia archaeon]|nr:diacylglycerol kinase family protein [Candidatus Nanoarchaeia archaeon]
MRQPLRHLTIINQTAGSYSAWEVKEIEKQLKRFPSSLTGEVVVTSSLSELEATLIRHQGECPDLLGLGGGDDTASWVLTMAERVWGRIPEIAYFSMGRVNSLTAFLGLSDGLADKIKKVG